MERFRSGMVQSVQKKEHRVRTDYWEGVLMMCEQRERRHGGITSTWYCQRTWSGGIQGFGCEESFEA